MKKPHYSLGQALDNLNILIREVERNEYLPPRFRKTEWDQQVRDEYLRELYSYKKQMERKLASKG